MSIQVYIYYVSNDSRYPVFSPAYLRVGAPYPFSADLSLKWDWGGAKTFDVYTKPHPPFPYAFNFGWGEQIVRGDQTHAS